MSNTRTQKSNGVYLRVGAVAALLGVNVKTVRRWIDTGRIEGCRMPGNVNQQQERRVHYEVLKAFLVRAGYTHSVRDLDARVKRENLAHREEAS